MFYGTHGIHINKHKTMNGSSLFKPKLGFQNKANVHYKHGVESNWMFTKWSVKVESCSDDNYGKRSAFNK